MKVSIVTVTHNSYKNLISYTNSFIKNHEFLNNEEKKNIEIIFVENSGDDISYFKKKLLVNGFKAEVLNSKNHGFGAACNLGAKVAIGDLLIFINPDIEFKSSIYPNGNFKNKLFGTCLQFNKSKFPFSFDFLPEYKNILFDQKFILLIINISLCFVKKIPLIFFPVGSFIFIEKKLFKEIGMFNEEFFLYYEEAELSKRIYKIKKINPHLIRNIKIFHKTFGSHQSKQQMIENETKGFKTYCKLQNDRKIYIRQIRRLRVYSFFSNFARQRYNLMIKNIF